MEAREAEAVRLRQALRRDLDDLAMLWVGAFRTDPFLRWMGGDDDDAWPAFGRDWFGFILDRCFERGHTYCSDPPGLAIAWIPPDLTFVTAEDVTRGVAVIERHAGDERSQAALATIVEARSRGLEESHWTLQYIGIDPAHQGRGWGAAAVLPMLERIDADGLPCGLVSSNPRNVSFYERCGFAVTAEVTTPDGAATIRPMARPSSPAP